MSSDSARPPDGHAWDLLVVGGGTAGLVAAKTAAGLGASVLLAEPGRPGGDCLWTGCVPSKALLRAAHAAHDARYAGRFGVRADVTVDFAAVRAYVRQTISTIEPVDSAASLRAAGVRVIEGRAEFAGASTARVGDDEIAFRQAMVATGSQPAVPPTPGLAAANPLTSDTIWDVEDLPPRLLVIGGGSVGCELAQAFARLGSAVTLVEQAVHLLPSEIAEVGAVLDTVFAADGIDVRCASTVLDIRDGTARLSAGSPVTFDAVLVAAGRTPRTTHLGLEAAGVDTDAGGYVVVNAARRTSNPRIWAAGDVTGCPLLTHVAGVHASLAASNAVLGLRRTVDRVVPRVTFTQPEIASVGEQSGTVRTTGHGEVDRAVTDGDPDGFSRLVADRRRRVIGATIVGPRAGESLAEVALAVRQGVRMRDLAGLTHAYPTYADGVWKAGIADVAERLGTGFPRRVSRLLSRSRRARLDRG
ncbi:MAG: dihydrolipoyl dehydrogenase family protein [Jatrophihabitans sp.]